jgi:hypothetical protein
MDLRNFGFEIDADGIAVFTWDMAGKSMNVIDLSVLDDIEARAPTSTCWKASPGSSWTN